MCTVLLITWLMPGTLYMAYLPGKYVASIVYIPTLLGIFVSGTYLAISYEVDIVVSCVWKMLPGKPVHMTIYLQYR